MPARGLGGLEIRVININTINIVYWGYIGIMENKMETTIVGLYRDYYLRSWRLVVYGVGVQPAFFFFFFASGFAEDCQVRPNKEPRTV